MTMASTLRLATLTVALGAAASLAAPLTTAADEQAREAHLAAERVRIQRHLSTVERDLRQAPAPDPALTGRREALLDVLAAYTAAGRFPQNRPSARGEVRPPLTPIFMDDDANVCAVGHLMLEDGAVEAAFEVVANENLARVPDMTTPALVDWARTSGFTVDELARIQPQYRDQPPACQPPNCVSVPCYVPALVCPTSGGVLSSQPGVCGPNGVGYANACIAAGCLVFDVDQRYCAEPPAPGAIAPHCACAQPSSTVPWWSLMVVASLSIATVRRRRR